MKQHGVPKAYGKCQKINTSPEMDTEMGFDGIEENDSGEKIDKKTSK